MKKVKLLNSGDYSFLSCVKFPVVVNARHVNDHCAYVETRELRKLAGVNGTILDSCPAGYMWTFLLDDPREAKVLNIFQRFNHFLKGL